MSLVYLLLSINLVFLSFSNIEEVKETEQINHVVIDSLLKLRKNPEKFIRFYEEQERIHSDSDWQTMESKAFPYYLEASFGLEGKSKFYEAINYLEENNSLHFDLVEQQMISFFRGYYFFSKGYLTKSEKLLQDAILQEVDVLDNDYQERIFELIGGIKYYRGDYSSSLRYLLQALEMLSRAEDRNKIAGIYFKISRVFLKLKDYERARENMQKVVENGDELELIRATISKLEIQFEESHEDIDITELLKTKRYLDAENLNSKAPGLSLFVSKVYMANGFNDSISFAYDLYDLNMAIGNLIGLSLVSELIAEWEMKLGDNEKALVYMNKAFELSSELGMMRDASNQSLWLSKYYGDKEVYKEALKFLDLNRAYRDSIATYANEAGVATQDQLFVFQQKKKEQELKHEELIILEKNKVLYLKEDILSSYDLLTFS
jgi:tetratricopeptide (TPR) repeat protein